MWKGTISAEAEFNPATTPLTFTFAMTDLGEMRSMLRHIRSLAPRASVRTVAASADHIKRGLETGEIDLAVGYFPDLRDKAFTEQHLFFHHFACLLRADHPITATTLSLAQFLSVEHVTVSGAGRTFEIIERYLKSRKIQRRVALETPHFMTIPFVISQSDLIATVPHAVGVYAKSMQMNIRIAQPPMRTPRLDLKMHWHRNFQRDPKNRWLRGAVASLFTDEPEEWPV